MDIQIYPKRGAGGVVKPQSATGVVPKQTDIGRLLDNLLGLDAGATDEFATVPNPFEGTMVDPYAKQMLAGAAELPYYSGAIYGMLGLGYDVGVDWLGEQVGIEDAGRMPPGTLESLELAQHGSKQANESFDTTAPSDIGETIARALPNLIGGPVAAAPKSLGKMAAKDALEVITPFTVATAGKYPVQATANVAVGTIAGDVLNDVSDPEYTSILDQIHGFGTDDAAFSIDGTPLTSMSLDDAIAHDQMRVDLDPVAQKMNTVLRKVDDDIEEDDLGSELAIFGLGAMFGARGMRSAFGAASQTDTVFRTTTIAGNVKAGIVDQMWPIVEATKKLNPARAEWMKARADTGLSAMPLRQSIEHAHMTGELPTPVMVNGQLFKIPAVRQFNSVVGKTLNKQELKDFNDYLLYKDELGNRTAYFNKPNVTVPARIYHPNVSTYDMTQIVARGRANTKFVELERTYRQIIDGALEYAMRRGRVSPNDFAAWRNSFPNYVPRVNMAREDVATQIFNGLIKPAGDYDPGRGVGYLMKRDLDPASPDTKNNMVPPTVVLEDYVQAMIREAEQNGVRRDFGAIVDRAKRAGNTIDGLRVSDSANNNKNIEPIKFYRDGKPWYIHVDDAALRVALESRPLQYIPLLNQIRRTKQMFTTGFMNPLRSLTTSMYDAFLAPVLKQKGVKIGLLGTAIDPTDYAMFPVGVARYLKAGIAREFSHLINTKIMADAITGNNGGVLQMMLGGRRNMHKFGALMGRVYANSTLSLYENLAAGQGRYVGGYDPGDPDDVLKMMMGPGGVGGLSARAQPRRVATLIFDALHNGMKIQATARTGVKNMPRDEQIKMAAKIRDLTGDPAKSGSWRAVQHTQSMTPYGTIYIQSLRQLFRQAKQRPHVLVGQMALPVAATIGLAAYYSSDPKKADTYWNKMTPKQRTSGYVIIPEGAEEQWSMIRTDPMLQFIHALALHQADAIFGFSDGRFASDPALQAALNEYIGTIMATEDVPFSEAKEMAMEKSRATIAEQDERAARSTAIDPGLPVPVELLGIGIGQRIASSPVDWMEGRSSFDARREQLTGEATERTPNELAAGWVADSIDTIYGITGAALYGALDSFTKAKEAGFSTEEAYEQTAEQLASEMIGKQMPFGNTFFGDYIATSTASADAVAARRKLESVKEIVGKLNKTERGSGATSLSNPQPLPGFVPETLFSEFLAAQDPSLPDEQKMARANAMLENAISVLQWNNAMSSGPLDEIHQLNAKLASKKADASLSPKARTAEANVIAAQIDKFYAEILVKSMTLEQMLNYRLRQVDPEAEEVTLETLLP